MDSDSIAPVNNSGLLKRNEIMLVIVFHPKQIERIQSVNVGAGSAKVKIWVPKFVKRGEYDAISNLVASSSNLVMAADDDISPETEMEALAAVKASLRLAGDTTFNWANAAALLLVVVAIASQFLVGGSLTMKIAAPVSLGIGAAFFYLHGDPVKKVKKLKTVVELVTAMLHGIMADNS